MCTCAVTKIKIYLNFLQILLIRLSHTKMYIYTALPDSNSLPNDTILDMSKFKASTDDKFGVAEII